jgi:hypothetical protein
MYMSKQIMVSEELYTLIKDEADLNCRSLSGQIQYYINKSTDKTRMVTQHMDLPPVDVLTKTIHTEVGFDQYGLPIYKDVPIETYTIDEGISALQGRTIVQILTDINKRKQTLTQDLNYCQDADTKLQIEADGKEDLDALWAEYKEAKAR